MSYPGTTDTQTDTQIMNAGVAFASAGIWLVLAGIGFDGFRNASWAGPG